MHELAVTRDIVDIVLRNAQEQEAKHVLNVRLIVGKMRNFEQAWVQNYFDRLAEGTIAEGAQIQIEYVPLTFYCHSCGATFQMKRDTNERMRCAECGSNDYNMVTGGEFLIKEIEIV